MFKEGDSVRFISCDVLGGFSGRKGTIVRRLNDDEVAIEDWVAIEDDVYEVYVPICGNVQVLEGFIRAIEEWF